MIPSSVDLNHLFSDEESCASPPPITRRTFRCLDRSQRVGRSGQFLVRVEIGGPPLWIVSPEDLILSKLAWAKTSRSEMQRRDVRQILTAVSTLDQTYLDHWAARLTVTDLLREVRA